eukprot:4767771-Karenia_brevis.AAC.1
MCRYNVMGDDVSDRTPAVCPLPDMLDGATTIVENHNEERAHILIFKKRHFCKSWFQKCIKGFKFAVLSKEEIVQCCQG